MNVRLSIPFGSHDNNSVSESELKLLVARYSLLLFILLELLYISIANIYYNVLRT